MADAFNCLVNGRLINPFLLRQPAGLLRFALPFGFRKLREFLIEYQPIFLGQLLNSLEDFLNGFTHGNTSRGRMRNGSIAGWELLSL